MNKTISLKVTVAGLDGSSININYIYICLQIASLSLTIYLSFSFCFYLIQTHNNIHTHTIYNSLRALNWLCDLYQLCLCIL